MANIKIIRNTIVVESGFTYEQIEKLKKYAPEALELKDKDGNPTFAATLAADGEGSITKFGIAYGRQADKTKPAAVTFRAPTDVKDVKGWFMENVGVKVNNVNAVEAQYEEALGKVSANIKAIEDSIKVED